MLYTYVPEWTMLQEQHRRGYCKCMLDNMCTHAYMYVCPFLISEHSHAFILAPLTNRKLASLMLHLHGCQLWSAAIKERRRSHLSRFCGLKNEESHASHRLKRSIISLPAGRSCTSCFSCMHGCCSENPREPVIVGFRVSDTG